MSQNVSQKSNKIWDGTFKDIFQAAPSLFLPLIKEAFGVSYEKEDIVPLDNSLYDEKGNMVVTDNVLRIGNATYHFECQYTNDGTMAFRMWEYDAKLALRDYKMSAGRTEINFPQSCVVYIARNSKYPEELELKINFQDSQSVIFKVPAIRIQDYGIDTISQKKLWLFYPFMPLQFKYELKAMKRMSEQKVLDKYQEVLDKYKKMIDAVDLAYSNKELDLDDTATILEAIHETSQYALEKYQNIVEGVNDMMGRTLQLKHKEIEREAERKVQEKMVVRMKKNGAEKKFILKVVDGNIMSKEEVDEILDNIDNQDV